MKQGFVLVMALYLMGRIAYAEPIAWSRDQARDNALDIVKFIKKAEKDLRYAVSVGDDVGIFEYIQLPISRILRGWNEQRMDLKNGAVTQYEQCNFAALDFQRYTDTFRKPDSLSNRNERETRARNYQSELKNCTAALGSKP